MIGKAQDVATYAPLGVLGTIDDTYLDRGLDAARENVTVDGKTYGMVYNALYQGVYYNKAMFEENGWEIPKTQDDLQKIIDDCNAKGITPFASHMVDTWSIGNVTMQFAMNDVFNKDPPICRMFTNDSQLLGLTTITMRIMFSTVLVIGLQMVNQNAFVALGNTWYSFIFGIMRKLLLLLPLAIFLPHIIGVWGIYMAEAISNVLTTFITQIYFSRYMRKLAKN